MVRRWRIVRASTSAFARDELEPRRIRLVDRIVPAVGVGVETDDAVVDHRIRRDEVAELRVVVARADVHEPDRFEVVVLVHAEEAARFRDGRYRRREHLAVRVVPRATYDVTVRIGL